MSDAEDVKFYLKVFVNKQRTKVLFAEADSNFADVLISFLTLPLGTAVKVLKKHYGDDAPVFGSVTTLYNGLANLDSKHFWTEGCKEVLLNPTSSFRAVNGAGGVFTVNTMSFIISDDLHIFPISNDFIQTLEHLGITDIDLGDVRTVTLGLNEIMDLLKGSILSSTPLSDIIFNKTQVGYDMPKSEMLETWFCETEIESFFNSKKMINLKVMVQKSTNKLLFALADEEFVDFLFGLLAVPFATVECLLGNRTCLKCIDNLYTSITDHIEEKHFVTTDVKNWLMKAMFVKDEGEYIRGPTLYKITDDLTVTPFCMASTFSSLKDQNILELELQIGSEEALSILKASLTSTSALTVGLKINRKLMKQPMQEQ